MTGKFAIIVIEMIIGFSSGIVIGSAFVALLIVLGVIQRLLQLINYHKQIFVFVLAMLFGVILGTYISFTSEVLKVPIVTEVAWGFVHGVFNGMLAAALVEILNVFPLLSRRLGLQKYLYVLLTAVIFGKVCGSLFQWLFLVKY